MERLRRLAGSPGVRLLVSAALLARGDARRRIARLPDALLAQAYGKPVQPTEERGERVTIVMPNVPRPGDSACEQPTSDTPAARGAE